METLNRVRHQGTPQPLRIIGHTDLTPENLLTPEQAARLLGISVRTLAAWRSTGRQALPYIRCGGRIRYQRSALSDWLSRQKSTAVQGVA